MVNDQQQTNRVNIYDYYSNEKGMIQLFQYPTSEKTQWLYPQTNPNKCIIFLGAQPICWVHHSWTTPYKHGCLDDKWHTLFDLCKVTCVQHSQCHSCHSFAASPSIWAYIFPIKRSLISTFGRTCLTYLKGLALLSRSYLKQSPYTHVIYVSIYVCICIIYRYDYALLILFYPCM